MIRVGFENSIVAIRKIASLFWQRPVAAPKPGIGTMGHNGFVRPAR